MPVHAEGEYECKLPTQKCVLFLKKKEQDENTLIDCVFIIFRLIVRVYRQQQQ